MDIREESVSINLIPWPLRNRTLVKEAVWRKVKVGVNTDSEMEMEMEMELTSIMTDMRTSARTSTRTSTGRILTVTEKIWMMDLH